jgi:O-antigen/teichoic acid export membrane protein
LALSPLMRMLAGTTLASGITVGITLVYTGALASRLGPQEFGAYSLAMRVASLVLPFTTLAMGVAVPRYVAVARGERERRAYLLAGLLLALLPGLPLLLAGALAPGGAARLLFGSAHYAPLLLGALCVLAGYSCFTLFYGYYRGLGRMGPANWGQLLFTGIAPAVVVFSPVLGGSVARVVALVGVAAGAALVPLLLPAFTALREGVSRQDLRGAVRDLAGYGAPRAPGGVIVQLVMDLGPLLAPRWGMMADAGFLMFGLAGLKVAETAASAFGIVVLPKVAALHAEGQQEFLRERVTDLVAFVLHLGLFLFLHLLVWARPLILVWLGSAYAPAVPVVQVTLAGLIPYLLYVMLRSVIDGVENRPVNTLNGVVALAVVAAGIGLSRALRWGVVGVAASTAAGLWTLAALSVGFLRRRIGLNGRHLLIGQCFAANAALLVPSVLAAAFLEGRLHGIALVAAGALLEGVLLAGYCLLEWRMGARWAAEVVSRVWSARPNERPESRQP